VIPEDETAYQVFADKIYRTCILSDPWLYGEKRFRLEPVLLPIDLYERMCQAAEEIGRLYDELCQLIIDRPASLDQFFNLTPYQKLMWLSSGGRWHGIARLDMFVLQDGSLKICEMNSDTPSGEAEAVWLNRLQWPDHSGLVDPNGSFEDAFFEMVLEASRLTRIGKTPEVGIIYPTEMPEDLSMIRLYQKGFEERGCHVTLGSPFNIRHTAAGEIRLFDTTVEMIVRHYKTDWWGERWPVWYDEEDYPDPDPLDVQLQALLRADMENRVTIINPFGAALTQNKLTMAFFWKMKNLFSPVAQNAIAQYIPETYRLKDVVANALNKEAWVLKSDYGCEGAEVIIGKYCTEEIWRESLAQAIPERWIVQKYFEAEPIEGDLIPNYGVYLIAGKAAGIYTRLSNQATDYTSLSAATFIIQK